MIGWRMRPTASALGVIAIASVMITATASEADIGTIESSINHPGTDEDNRRMQEDDGQTNQTSIDDLTITSISLQNNDTANEITFPTNTHPIHLSRENRGNVSHETNVNDPQKDQSEVLPIAVNDVPSSEHDAINSNTKQSERDDPGNKMERVNNDFLDSVRSSTYETSINTDPWSGRSLGLKNQDGVEIERSLNVLSQGNLPLNEFKLPNSRGMEKPIVLTTTTIQEIIGTMAKPLERTNVDDIRAISFQVPMAGETAEEYDLEGRNDEAKKLTESRKDHSKSVNNLLLGGGKSTKAFYEIKPSIRTEMEADLQSSNGSLIPLAGRKFVLPNVDNAFGKFGPYFEDGDQEMNITARIGSTMLLDCKIGMLGDKKVSWLQQHSKDSFRLLTVGQIPYSVDQRISLNFRYPSNWRLQILYANPRDSGLYKCQVATHPPLVKTINVTVTAPELTITDDSGRVVPKERHLKAGSALKLRCEARDIMESLKESVVWTRGDEILGEDVSENRTTEIVTGREVLVIVSTLTVDKATPRDAGNYSCLVPGKAKTTIAVHVLNGELPAAVHDGNGVSRAFLNLWLIHLTMSYVFSR